jgi:hypothetical protein
MIKIAANSLWECEGFIDQGKLFPDPSAGYKELDGLQAASQIFKGNFLKVTVGVLFTR